MKKNEDGLFMVGITIIILLESFCLGCNSVKKHPVEYGYTAADQSLLPPKDREKQEEKTEKLIKRQDELERRHAGQLRPTFR